MPAPYRVLFICTGNSCRSQMCEALLRKIGGERFIAASAGSQPALVISSLARETMRRMNIPMEDQYSKKWDLFIDQPQDVIITVCDSAATTPCPAWPGRPVTAHWSLPDPSFFAGTEEQRLALARHVAEKVKAALEQLIQLPFDELTPEQLREEIFRLAPDTSDFRLPPP